MKGFIIPILLLLLMTQAFSKWMIVLEYELNKEYIAAKLCENKALPVLKCKGKCQLAKKMTAESTSNDASNYQVKFQEVSFTDTLLSQFTLAPSTQTTPVYASFVPHGFTEPDFPIFHPPA
jgi:hypothetical protein